VVDVFPNRITVWRYTFVILRKGVEIYGGERKKKELKKEMK
jgi:hypothetical protein